MATSQENPVYSVYVISGTTKYNITPAVTGLSLAEQDQQMAQSASIEVVNAVFNGNDLATILTARQRVFIYANTGDGNQEVFRGYIWTKIKKTTTDESLLTVKCYDNLIYLQESEDALYFSKGKNTESVMTTICKNWGISLDYSYSTITHGKLALRGTLSDLIITDILDQVKKKTGKKYVVRSEKDTMQVLAVGSNTTVYTIQSKNNAVQTRSEQTLDELVTKVVILGKQNKNDSYPIKATIKGDTATYGTLQKLQDIGEDSLSTAKKEAQNTIDENGEPKWIYEIVSPDIPWIRKGDKIKVNAGDISGTLIVRSTERSISSKEKTMTLTCDKP